MQLRRAILFYSHINKRNEHLDDGLRSRNHSTMANLIAQGPGAIDPVGTYAVKHTVVDFNRTAWSYRNCKMVFDHPHTVKTLDMSKPCCMYALLKLTPGLYLCRVRSRSPQPNCRLELLEKDVYTHAQTCRSGCMCHSVTDLQLMVAVDTNMELRITFTTPVERRVPSFDRMEVRVKQHLVMPLRVPRVCAGSREPHPVRYNLSDMKCILQKVLYAVHWMEELETNIDQLIQLVTNPLWDIYDPTNAHEYEHLVQEVQTAIVETLPRTFVTSSFRYTVRLFTSMRFPLISQTLVTELSNCFRTEQIDHDRVASVLRQSLRYINFLLVEFAEFKQQLTETITKLGPKQEKFDVVTVTV